MKYSALALLLTTVPAAAGSPHAVYGVGAESCEEALSHDWTTQGEVAWVAGFMTASSMAAAKKDIYPDHGTKDLVCLVYHTCKESPSSMLAQVTETVMWNLWDAQQPKGEKF